MIYVCSWCNGVIKMTTAAPLHGESNGICIHCVGRHFPDEERILNGKEAHGINYDHQ